MMASPNPTPNPQDPLAVEEQEPQVMAVRVINKNDFPIRDMFDGVPYVFEPNKPVNIPPDAANHIFAWFQPYDDEDGHHHEPDPARMKAHVQKRFGWNTPSLVQDSRADFFYRNLVVQPIVYRMVPMEIEEPAPRGRAGKGAEARA